jgi:uncharacterized membrane protein YeaQ/YmgE (transglycosylase-associated protein family)
MIGLIISLLVIGLIAGFIARAVVGSFVGGFLGFLLFQHDPTDGFFQPAGIIGSIIGAIVVLAIWVAVSGRRSAARR